MPAASQRCVGSFEVAAAANAAAKEGSASAGRLEPFSCLYIRQADKLEEHLGPETLPCSLRAIHRYPPDSD